MINEQLQLFIKKINNEEKETRFKELIEWIIEKFPELLLEFKWNQPMFIEKGTYIIGFSVSKKHIALGLESFAIEELTDRITNAGFSHSKMIVQFPWEKPIDYQLLDLIITHVRARKSGVTSFWI